MLLTPGEPLVHARLEVRERLLELGVAALRGLERGDSAQQQGGDRGVDAYAEEHEEPDEGGCALSLRDQMVCITTPPAQGGTGGARGVYPLRPWRSNSISFTEYVA